MGDRFLDSVKGMVKYWWVSLIVGVLALIVGCWAFAAPLATISILTIFVNLQLNVYHLI